MTTNARWAMVALACAALMAKVNAQEDLQLLDPAKATTNDDGSIAWFNALDIGLEGQGWTTGLKHPYDRFPAEAEGVVPPSVWRLAQHSAGLCVRFLTDSPTLSVRWTLRDEDLAMNHMAATGVSGVDLYARRDGKWGWVAVGRPEKQQNESTLLAAAPEGLHEYLLYCPLYNGTDKLEIGVKPGSRLAKPPAYPAGHEKPILFWGTSILQGGCASRTGMAYPAIIGRHLDYPTINLGFSGNGKMDPEVTALIAKLDVAAYVIDCAPNMKPDLIAERTEPLVRTLREAHPDTAIVLVENIHYQQGWFIAGSREGYEQKNKVLREAYDRLVAGGVKNLYYIHGDNLLGDDSEATVDGTHATDLGFLRMAEAIEPFLRDILK